MNAISIVSIVCSALVLVSFASIGAEEQHASSRCKVTDDRAPQVSILKVGSYNILHQNGYKGTPNEWDKRKDDLVNLIRKMDLDVCGLQEDCSGQADFLTNALPQYALVGAHREDGMRKGEASPILYRKKRFEVVKSGTFWLSTTFDVPGSTSWGGCPRVCSWMWLKDLDAGNVFCFANTHLDLNAVAQKEGMSLIVRKMHELVPLGMSIVFTGDHNCSEIGEPAQIVSKMLKNAMYISETAPIGPWRSYNAYEWTDHDPSSVDMLKLPVDKRGCRLDYIYVSDGVRVKSYVTHGDPRPNANLYPSDHFPVTAEVEL